MIDYSSIKNLRIDRYFYIGIFIIMLLFNYQLLDNSNINFALTGHDEYLTVREVYSILNPLSMKHLFMAIISGDILYYGRIVFYLDAIVAFLPFKIFGISGLVYSIRMFHVLMAMGGIIILGNTFLKDVKYRLFFYLSTLTLYYSFYFYMVPKPEPFQLFFLALFFYYFKKANFKFGNYFILLGVAYGIKFNAITLIPLLFIVPIMYQKYQGQLIKKLALSILYFIIGLIIAVPCLILAPVKPVFLKSYINATFLNTSQYDDNANLGIFDWLSKGWFGAYNGGLVFGCILIVFIIIVLIFGLKKLMKEKLISNDLLFISSGLCLILPIILFTDRLWPHYLWTGYIFLMLGIVIFMQTETISETTKKISNVAFILLLVGSIYCSVLQERKLTFLSEQTNSLNENGKKAYNYLRAKKQKFIAIQDMTVPYPFKNMLEVKRYHPFSGNIAGLNAPSQQFIWSGFITPQIIADNQADYIITNKTNFSDTAINLQTNKDEIIIANNKLMNAMVGKSVFLDTTFGPIKLYKIIK